MSTAAQVDLGWVDVCALDDLPVLGARVVERAADAVTGARKAGIAIFRNTDDEVFALEDRCPHKGGPLSQGIVFGRKVACPLHNWTIGLVDGEAAAPDHGCTRHYAVRIDGGRVLLDAAALDSHAAAAAAPACPVTRRA
ncbi:nitrite reductase small subunit NirD [soil metagenome]